MYANERPSSHGNRPSPRRHRSRHPNRQQVPEETIRVERLQVERKSYIFTLKENPRGRFLRITEDVGGLRDSIIIPTTGLTEFSQLLEEMLSTSESVPEQETDE
ncbi:MAG: RNA-binding protein [Limisphaerales bacterium]